MSSSESKNEKILELKKNQCLNPKPQKTKDPLFLSRQFFDVHDLVQVKYEMLRKVLQENQSVKAASSLFGFSRVAFYQILATFEKKGLSGLMPNKRGPKQRHKLTPQIMEFVRDLREKKGILSPKALAHQIYEKFALRIHVRSLQRALATDKKKTSKTRSKNKSMRRIMSKNMNDYEGCKKTC